MPTVVRHNVPTEEQARQAEMRRAQQRSRDIDVELQETKRSLDKKRRAIKLLLLGQSESGKTSLVKNFQMAFTPTRFSAERFAWRTIIQLNVISTIKRVLAYLEFAVAQATSHQDSSALGSPVRRYRLALSPLLAMEESLKRELTTDTLNEDYADVCVRAGGGWKTTLNGMLKNRSATPRLRQGFGDNENLLTASKDQILDMWEDSWVQDTLRSIGANVEQTPGFFLSDITRVAAADYEPTDTDIIRARIRTVGVEEHHFVMEKGLPGSDFYITDVSGSKSTRHQWIPYFDDAQAILFLAPLSFNMMLPDDPRTNRLEDTLGLWKMICANKLLQNCSLILFLNKRDLLEETLKAGVQVKDWVPSYGDAPNEVEHVTTYFRERFKINQRKLSPIQRPFICYSTAAIDTKATTALLVAVHTSLIREHLRETELI
ncbi:guanine nucleotide binding protein, alpha subunit [Schizophyllum amplum]|uniref:Guanine nucleotide binding protein, alpha subunit n=1 Tax=Schizophyllum amplum TaxID=97359 RepID=A0A550CPX8_9AGAR|nr:guanine nucleotide binding protein, alpha subunit [Auriculariopsis ampla]